MNPSGPEVLSEFIKAHLYELRVSMPARVVEYDPATQRVSVQPEVQDGRFDEDEQREAVTLPVLTNVPLVFPGGAGGRITFPIEAGDGVLLIISSSSISRWKAVGGTVDPARDHRHKLEDAIAIPGLFASPPTLAPEDATVVHSDNLLLGGPDADDAVAVVSKVQAALKGVLADPTVAGAIAAVGAPGGPAALTAAVNAYFVGHPMSGASNVKAK